jgi:hypothetical protein
MYSGLCLARQVLQEARVDQADTDLFLRHWRDIKIRARQAPNRRDFDPARLKICLPSLMMLEQTDPDYVFRLSGGSLVHLHGRELRGESFISLFTRSSHLEMAACLQASMLRQMPLSLSVQAQTSQNQNISLTITLAPLCNDHNVTDRLVGLYETKDDLPALINQKIMVLNLISSRLLGHVEVEKADYMAAPLRLVASHGQRLM